MDIIERDIYALIASGDGIKAREIAKKLNSDLQINFAPEIRFRFLTMEIASAILHM